MDTKNKNNVKSDHNKSLAKYYSHKPCRSSEIKRTRKMKEHTSIAIQNAIIEK